VAVWAKGQYGTMLGGKISPARQIDAPATPSRPRDTFDDNAPW
jgi:hypothetical protein